MKFAPQIAPQVRRMIEELDDGIGPVAAIWRDVGHRARKERLLQPSYESVRRLIRAQRRTRPSASRPFKRALKFVLELLRRRRRPQTLVVVVLSSDELRRLLRDYERRPRDTSSRTRTRAAA